MARPTLVSLARELGVSRQTVSNVINAPHLVRPETRQRVEAAIKASGYRPNVVAQQLRSQRSRTVAMRIYPSSDGIYGAVMDRFLHQLVAECRVHGYNLMPITATDDQDEVEQLIGLYDRGSIDGCLLSGTSAMDLRLDRLAERGVPRATYGRPWHDPDAPHYWVDVDGAAAEAEATRRLWSAGFRRIAFIGMLPGSGPGDERRRGWREALAELDPTADLAALDSENADAVEEGLAATERLSRRGADAFVCASDSLALGAVVALRRLLGTEQLELPVVGYDDTSVASALGFSSVGQPVEMAVHLLMHALIEEMTAEPGRSPDHGGGVLLEAQAHFRGRLAPHPEGDA